MKRRFLLVLLTMLIMSMMTTVCFADDIALTFSTVPLLENEGRYLVNDSPLDEGVLPEGDSWALYQDGVLTLHNYGIHYNEGTIIFGNVPETQPLVINLEGDNVIDCDQGVVFEEYDNIESLTFTGSGSLTINANESGITSFTPVKLDSNFTGKMTINACMGLIVDAFVMDNGNLILNCADQGIECYTNLQFNGGNVELDITDGLGIYAYDVFEINGGKIEIKSPSGRAIALWDETDGVIPTIKEGYKKLVISTDLEGTQMVDLTLETNESVQYMLVNYNEEPKPEEEIVPVEDNKPTSPDTGVYDNVVLLAIIFASVLGLSIITVLKKSE